MAQGDLQLAKKLADALPENMRGQAYERILANSGYAGPAAVQEAFQLITPDPSQWWTDEIAMAGMAQSIRMLGTRDPDAVLHLAKLYEGSQAGALVMLDAADAAPMPGADALYKDAFAATSDSQSQQCTPGMVAEHAWLRDKPLGVQLFGEAQQRITEAYATGMVPQAASDFAFYYSRVDPAFSRTMIERQWAADTAPTASDSSFFLRGDALAMVAIDPHRALGMAHAIPDEDERLDAIHRIAQYIMEPRGARDMIPFDVWSAGMIQLPDAMPEYW
jgi:hypothetical protein